MNKIIIYNNRYYYLYDSYTTWDQAKRAGIAAKRRNHKNHWYILKSITGGLFPTTRYYLYMDKVRNLSTL